MKTYLPALKRLARVLNRAKDEKDLQDLLEDLLTPSELHDIDERILIVKALKEGLPQRTVSKKLGVSIAKVTRGSQLIQYGKGALASFIEFD